MADGEGASRLSVERQGALAGNGDSDRAALPSQNSCCLISAGLRKTRSAHCSAESPRIAARPNLPQYEFRSRDFHQDEICDATLWIREIMETFDYVIGGAGSAA